MSNVITQTLKKMKHSHLIIKNENEGYSYKEQEKAQRFTSRFVKKHCMPQPLMPVESYALYI